jgi:hypothetical protein
MASAVSLLLLLVLLLLLLLLLWLLLLSTFRKVLKKIAQRWVAVSTVWTP